MRFNDEVQFTLMCVRVPEPVVEKPSLHRSISTDCMTFGDTVVLPAAMRKLLVESRSIVRYPDPDAEKTPRPEFFMDPAVMDAPLRTKDPSKNSLEECVDQLKSLTGLRKEMFGKGGTVDKVLDAAFPQKLHSYVPDPDISRQMPWMQCSDDNSGGPPQLICDWIAENGGWTAHSASKGLDGLWRTEPRKAKPLPTSALFDAPPKCHANVFVQGHTSATIGGAGPAQDVEGENLRAKLQSLLDLGAPSKVVQDAFNDYVCTGVGAYREPPLNPATEAAYLARKRDEELMYIQAHTKRQREYEEWHAKIDAKRRAVTRPNPYI